MKYPEHIAFIPDGNRTRATQRDYPTLAGHKAGLDNMINITQHLFSNTSTKVVTFWALSTENIIERSDDELNYLYGFAHSLESLLQSLLEKNSISFHWVGSSLGLPHEVLDILNNLKTKYNYNSGKTLVIAINYGGRDEIVRSVNKRLAKKEKSDTIDEHIISQYSDFGGLPMIDLVIRTKCHMASRISGFMLWCIGYAELYFSEILFPDFDTDAIDQAIVWYDQRAEYRNFGK